MTNRTLNEEQIAAVCYASLKGLEYLHDANLIHRDMKAANILLDNYGNAKLADFGVSAQLQNTYSKKKTMAGTPHWMSPEVLTKSEYNKKTDIWSLGITAIEMAEGDPPYSNMNYIKAMLYIPINPPKGLTCPESWSPEFNSFVARCLTVDNKQRPTAKELLMDPFIHKYILSKRPQTVLKTGKKPSKGAHGRAVLRELVKSSIKDIEIYRQTQYEDDSSEEDKKEGEEVKIDGLNTYCEP